LTLPSIRQGDKEDLIGERVEGELGKMTEQGSVMTGPTGIWRRSSVERTSTVGSPAAALPWRSRQIQSPSWVGGRRYNENACKPN
jgi:hypothetical protein